MPVLIKSPPTMWWLRLIFLLIPPAAATCFCSHSKTPTRIISKYLQYAYLPYGICLVNFFFAFFRFLNKIQDGRQNPMAHTRAWTASSICFMFGLKERPYSGRELKSFWCDSDNKNFDFYIIGTHSNNVLIWFTKRILGTVFLCPYNVCPKWLSLTSSQIRQNA